MNSKPLSAQTISSHAPDFLINYAHSIGIKRASLLKKSKITSNQIQDSEARIELYKIQFLWKEILNHSDMQVIGAEIGSKVTVSDVSTPGYLMKFSNTFAEALDCLCKYSVLFADDAIFFCRKHQHHTDLVVGTTMHMMSNPFRLHCRIALLLSLFREISNYTIEPEVISLPYGALGDLKKIEQTLRVEFSPGDQALLRFRNRDLETPLNQSDPVLSSIISCRADDLVEKVARHADIVDRVNDCLSTNILDPSLSLNTVAEKLGTSERSLQRKLRQHGVSFSELREDFRRQHADSLLTNPDLDIGEVAFLLGYQNASSFTRQFKAWNKITPKAYRKSLEIK